MLKDIAAYSCSEYDYIDCSQIIWQFLTIKRVPVENKKFSQSRTLISVRPERKWERLIASGLEFLHFLLIFQKYRGILVSDFVPTSPDLVLIEFENKFHTLLCSQLLMTTEQSKKRGSLSCFTQLDMVLTNENNIRSIGEFLSVFIIKQDNKFVLHKINFIE